VKTFYSYKQELAPTDDRDKGKGKEIAKDIPKRQKKCFNCHGYGHFQADCPNRRVLTIRKIKELDHIEVEEDEEKDSPDEGESSYLPPEKGEMLMIRRVLHATEAPSEVSQREQIFHPRRKVANKTYNLIIDGGSCTNVASTEMVSKLTLATINHPRPYALQWLKKGNEVTVSKQTLVPFSTSEYQDGVLHDVLPMDACHLLLGRPWQFDRDVTHYGQSNTYSFKLKGKKMTLTPLPPNQTQKPETGSVVHKESALLVNRGTVKGLLPRENICLLRYC